MYKMIKIWYSLLMSEDLLRVERAPFGSGEADLLRLCRIIKKLKRLQIDTNLTKVGSERELTGAITRSSLQKRANISSSTKL